MPASRYAAVQVQTASKERLMVMLFQAALRHLQAGASALDEHRHMQARQALGRAHEIVSELMASLNHQVAPALCEQLTDVYTAVLVQITRAVLTGSAEAARAASRILGPVASGFEEATRAPAVGVSP